MTMHSDSDVVKPTIIDLDPDQVTETTPGNKPDRESARESEAPTSTLKPTTPSKRSPLFKTSVLGASLLAAAVAGGWSYREYLSAYFPTNQMIALAAKAAETAEASKQQGERLEALERLSNQLKTDVDALESKTAGAQTEVQNVARTIAATTQRVDDLDKAMGAANTELGQVKSALASASQPAANGQAPSPDALAALALRIDTLEKDIASLKAQSSGAPSDTAALSQALSDLKAKISAGTAYAVELDRIQRMVPAAAGLDVLSTYAAHGLPDSKGLGHELSGLVAQLPKPEIELPKVTDNSWLSTLYEKLSGLITIRREGVPDWQKAAGAAAAFADAGDLPQALDYLTGLEGAKPAALQQWIDRAGNRLKLETALQSVEEAVLRVIAAKG